MNYKQDSLQPSNSRNDESGLDTRLEEGFIKTLLILPMCMPDGRDQNHIERKATLIQNANLTAKLYIPDSDDDPAFLSIGATSKMFMQQGIATAVEYLARSHEGLSNINGPLILCQIPETAHENFQLWENPVKVDDHRRVEFAVLPAKQKEVWRYRLESKIQLSPEVDPESTPEADPEDDLIDLYDDTPKANAQHPDAADKSEKPEVGYVSLKIHRREFEKYVKDFRKHLKEVVKRLQSEPDEMHMRINLGALLHLQISSKLKKDSIQDYERLLNTVMRRGNYHFTKDISYLSNNVLAFAHRVRLAIEASPKQFAPASIRVDSLQNVPVETTVVVFTKALRFDIQLQCFTDRQNSKQSKLELVRPTIYKRDLKNREKYVISANPDGGFDWDLEVLVHESQDKLNDSLRQIHRVMAVKEEPDGTFRPFFTDKKAQHALDVTLISTKSARTYEMGGYNIELAVYSDWDPQSGKRVWQSCAMSLYSIEWNEVLEKRNLAANPRVFGDCNSALLPVETEGDDGGARLLEIVERLQRFLWDRVCEQNLEKRPETFKDRQDMTLKTRDQIRLPATRPEATADVPKAHESHKVAASDKTLQVVPSGKGKAYSKSIPKRRAG